MCEEGNQLQQPSTAPGPCRTVTHCSEQPRQLKNQSAFLCLQPCTSFLLKAVKLSSFCLWSSHHLQQWHLHINELSHSSDNYCAEVPVLSPPCFLLLSINLSSLCKERRARDEGAVQQQQQTCRHCITHFALAFSQIGLCPPVPGASCSFPLSVCPVQRVCSPAPAWSSGAGHSAAHAPPASCASAQQHGGQQSPFTHQLKVQTAPAAPFRFPSMLV